MLAKFEQNRVVQTTRNFELFDNNNNNNNNKIFFFFLNNHFWQRVDVILEDVSVAEIIV